MIRYEETNRVFHLRTDHCSYLFGLLTDEVPVHLYWGERLPDTPSIPQLIQARSHASCP